MEPPGKTVSCDGCHKFLPVSRFQSKRTGEFYSRCRKCSEKHRNSYQRKTKKVGILEEYPELCKEWDFEKNELGPENYTKGSRRKVWWICKKNPCGCHRWKAEVRARVNGTSCPFCLNRKLCGHNNLLAKFPSICQEWDYGSNYLKPEEYPPSSGKKVWWICKKNPCGCHKWAAKIGDRTYGKNNCPFCTKGIRRSCPHNNLLIKFPDIAAEWDYKRNNTKPEDHPPFAHFPIWWICKKNPCGCHRWKVWINTRTNGGNSCPFCCNQKLCLHNNLLVIHPELCREWCWERNVSGPETFSPRTKKRVWWKCKKNSEHIWFSSPNSRVSSKSGCPRCNISHGERTIEEFFKVQDIRFESQKQFEDCKFKQKLSFDFYLPGHELFIEYDGAHHFDPESYYALKGDFRQTVKRDIIKLTYAKKTGRSMLRISYQEFSHISEIISAVIRDLKITPGPALFYDMMEIVKDKRIISVYEKHAERVGYE